MNYIEDYLKSDGGKKGSKLKTKLKRKLQDKRKKQIARDHKLYLGIMNNMLVGFLFKTKYVGTEEQSLFNPVFPMRTRDKKR